MDFTLLKKIGDTAFEMLDGEEINIEESPIRMKTRPARGYRDLEKLKNRVREKGFAVEGFSKEELLFICCYGRPQGGISPYVKIGAYNSEIFSGISSALTLALVKRYFT